jgi:AcrR family transcriptional regulator
MRLAMAGVKGQVQQRGVERRKAILEAAVELFSTYGYRGTGIAGIAEKAGITPSGVLHHFGSKVGLLRAVVEERDVRESERMAESFQQPGLEAIRSAYMKLARDNEADRELTALYAVLLTENLTPGEPLNEFFLRRSRGVRKSTRLFLEGAQAAGEIRADVDVRAVADEIIAFMEGAQLVWLQDPDRQSLVRLYKTYVDGLIERLRP